MRSVVRNLAGVPSDIVISPYIKARDVWRIEGVISTKHKENGATNAEIDIWLPTLDAFRTLTANVPSGMLLSVPSRTCDVVRGAA